MLDFLADTLLGRSLRLRHAEILTREPLTCLGSSWYMDTHYRLRVIGADDDPPRWHQCLCSVELDGLHLYPRTRKMDVHVHFACDSLRWFGRPEKYQPGTNEIWLHFESGGLWHLLRLRTGRSPMQRFVRALKQIATPEQVKAYRRRRPYVHYGPAPAWHAQQDLYGVWTVDPLAVYVYLTPYALVELDGSQVRQTLPLEQVQGIEVMRRADDPDAGGVVRFDHIGGAQPETLAYTLPDYIPFGAALAEAAKRSLEDPPIFYGKKKEDDEDE